MKEIDAISGYEYTDGGSNHSHDYLLPTLIAELEIVKKQTGGSNAQLFELGCGNGSVAARLAELGWGITGVDPSREGIAQARAAHPGLRLATGSAYDDLAGIYGRFPVVTSLEVVEHVYAPRDYAKTLYDLLEPGGTAIISTPFHGYWKNLAMALTGKMDAHFTALWDHGHIKFWSEKTLTQLLSEVGLEVMRFHHVGRIPALAKSMIVVARKPSADMATV